MSTARFHGGAGSHASAADAPVSETYELPLSVNQAAHVVLEWLSNVRGRPRVPVRPLVFATQWDGALNVPALELALTDVVTRHEALRAVFPDPNHLSVQQERAIAVALQGQAAARERILTQTIIPSQRVKLPIETIGTDEDDYTVVLRTRVAAAIALPFDYAAPMMRTTLYRVTDDRHVLLLVLHHLIADLWSLLVLAADIERAYNRQVNGASRGADIAPLPRQYGDLIRAECDKFATGLPIEEQAYWRALWASDAAAMLRPGDFGVMRDRHVASGQPCTVTCALAASTAARVRAAAKRHRVTAFMLCMTALALLFHSITRRQKLAWWIHAANRTEVSAESVIGWFAQGRLFGVDVRPGQTVVEVLRAVRARVCELAQRQDVPMHLVWRALDGRDAARFLEDDFVAFNMAPQVRASVELAGGVVMRPLPPALIPSNTGRALTFCATEAPTGIAMLGCSYSSVWFEPVRIDGMLRRFATLIDTVASSPQARADELAGAMPVACAESPNDIG